VRLSLDLAQMVIPAQIVNWLYTLRLMIHTSVREWKSWNK